MKTTAPATRRPEPMSTPPARQEIRFLRQLGDNAPHARRNHVLGVTAGTFAGIAMDFVQPELIIVGLVYALTRSPWLAALVPIINKGGSLGPQLIASIFLEHKARRRPYFIALTVLRTGSFAALAGAMYLLSISLTPWTLAVFFAVYLACCVTGGAGHVIFMDMIGRLIPTHRIGAFLGMRSFLGGGLSILTGLLIIQPVLAGVPLPTNYVILAAIGALLVGIDMTTFCLCREEPGPKADRPTTLGESLRRGLYWVRSHHNYRCYLWSRIAFRINYLGLAFFIPYGEQRISRQDDAAALALLGGIMVAVFKISGVAGSFIWGRVADRQGSRYAMIWGGALMTLSPLVALLAARLPVTFDIPLPYLTVGLTLPLLVYLVALALVTFGFKANFLGGHRFLITSAPPHRRASYVAFLNTVTSPLTLLPLLGAYLAESVGMDALFVLVTAGGALALLAAVRMKSDEHTTA
jgi:hypothetical protein